MIDTASGNHARLLAAGGHREVRAALDSRAAFVFSALLPKAFRDEHRAQLAENEVEMAAILAVEAAGVAATPDGAGGIVLEAMLFCEAPGQTTSVRQWAARQIDRAKNEATARLLLGSVLQGATVDLADRKVLVRARISAEVVERLAAFFSLRLPGFQR
jgi:hypothetical protein